MFDIFFQLRFKGSPLVFKGLKFILLRTLVVDLDINIQLRFIRFLWSWYEGNSFEEWYNGDDCKQMDAGWAESWDPPTL